MMFLKELMTFSILISIYALCAFGQTDELRNEVVFLTDSIGNRYPASEEDLRVRKHLLRKFADYGLECYEHTFDITEYMWGEGSLKLTIDNIMTPFIFGKDFVVQSRSATDTLSAEYIVILDAIPDSCQCLMQGKAVICPYKGEKGRTPTIAEMERAGAVAAIYVNPPQRNVMPTVSKGGRIHNTHKIPVLSINSSELTAFIPDSIADTLTGCIYAASPSHRIQIATKHHENHLQAANIIGTKKGSSDDYIIIGAHYDTVASDKESGNTMRGANDNASGVAMLIALAKRMSGIETRHNIMFIAFGGEEKGCLGSKEFVARMPFRKEYVREMINLDMVGQLEQGWLYYRQFNNPEIKPESITSPALHLTEGEDALSDHYDFAKENMPATYIHTGRDPVAHTADDTGDRLNYDGMAEILEFLDNYIMALSTTGCKPANTAAAQ